MSDTVRHGLHSGMRIYRLPPNTKWLIIDRNDGENCASELASALGAEAVHLDIGEFSESLYINFPAFNAVARSPITDAIRDHGLMSSEAKAAIEGVK